MKRIAIAIALGLLGAWLVVIGFVMYSSDVTVDTANGSTWCKSGYTGGSNSVCDDAINGRKVTSLLLVGLGAAALAGAGAAGFKPMAASLSAA